MDSSSAVDRGRDLVASAASLAVTGKNASLAPTEPTHTPVEGASRENAAGRIQVPYVLLPYVVMSLMRITENLSWTSHSPRAERLRS